MTDGKVLELTGVTKTFDGIAAVSDFTARVDPGFVTAFLGPNGAGKTTTLRILLGQLRASAGTATIGGKAFAQLSSPRRTVGWVAETPVFRPRRTAVKHLSIVARQAGLPSSRVGEVLDLVGLSEVSDIRISGYSLGMTQRLAVAEALLGDPGVLVLDEPANGLDPEGIRWIRLLIRRLADEGRTVLVSSHILSEIQQVADRLLVISNGSLVFAGAIEDLEDASSQSVAVDSPDRAGLSRALRGKGYSFELLRSGINVHRTSAAEIGALAADAGIALVTLQQRSPSLEDVFLKLVNGEYVPPMTAALEPHTAETDAAETDAADPQDGGVAPEERDDAGTREEERAQDAAARQDREDEALRVTVADVALASAGPGITAAAGASLAATAVAEAQRAEDAEAPTTDAAADTVPEADAPEDTVPEAENAAPEADAPAAATAAPDAPEGSEAGTPETTAAETYDAPADDVAHEDEPAEHEGTDHQHAEDTSIENTSIENTSIEDEHSGSDHSEHERADAPDDGRGPEGFVAEEWTIDGAAARPATTGTGHPADAPSSGADNADTFDVLEEADVVEYENEDDDSAHGAGLPGSTSLASLLAGEDEEVGGAASFLENDQADDADAPSDQTVLLPVAGDDDATVAIPTVGGNADETEQPTADAQPADGEAAEDDGFTFDDLLRGTGAEAIADASDED
ncbi:ATP-binding cassette domain-containing protein [Microbacterium betulae]|uniref:ATP-binding cassette domain-containing protein n=1 Tax=Microbacterium betulae TaxID=2981139 RepID=A0AA97FIM7_9MICO|nr:ATP-binding cassette domain-containing protein [Microbacterium sp. AB]WOF23403.1 ATP-binding cassette domain-containing protein [Microbacterium sp. AB]